MSEDRSLGELARAIDAFREDVREDLKIIRDSLAQFVLREVFIEKDAAKEARISKLEADRDDQRKAIRGLILMTASAIIAGVVLAIVVGTK